MKILPEIAEISQNFGPASLGDWNRRMCDHNQTVRRGERMRLIPGTSAASKLIFESLDAFMLQMHSLDIAKALRSLSVFGERVLPLIRREPLARAWWLHRDLLIQRRHWFALCRCVMNLVRLIGFGAMDCPSLPAPPSQHWPDRDVLESAALDAARVFGLFDDRDAGSPSLAHLVECSNSRTPLSRAAEE